MTRLKKYEDEEAWSVMFKDKTSKSLTFNIFTKKSVAKEFRGSLIGDIVHVIIKQIK